MSQADASTERARPRRLRAVPETGRPLKVLLVCHNHPSVSTGGVEVYTGELYQTMKASDRFEPLLLAGDGTRPGSHPATIFSLFPGDSSQTLTHAGVLDAFLLTSPDKGVYVDQLRRYLLTSRPDVVHFQHTAGLGLEALTEVRRTLPEVPLIYTLHDYIPICHHHGQMVTTAGRLCEGASPRECNRCYPTVSPQSFFMRERFIKAAFEWVDLFIAPTRFLRDRYLAWGLPAEKIICEPQGRLPVAPSEELQRTQTHHRIGYFGQLNPFKGITVLLEAMRLLGQSKPGATHLWVHGANLDVAGEDFQKQVRQLLGETGGITTFVGPYRRDQLRERLAQVDWVVVPSVWWENHPLVIQEAFMMGRPVICSDIGGMAELVTDGVNGLHFRVGDAADLARVLKTATQTKGLWQKLRGGIPRIATQAEALVRLEAIYRRLVVETRGRAVGRTAPSMGE